MSFQHRTFSRLVEEDSDIIGMIAYTLYKREKIEWINAFTTSHGLEPTDTDIRDYFNILTDKDAKIDEYRKRAETIMQEIINEVIADDLEIYREELKNHIIYNSITSSNQSLEQKISSTSSVLEQKIESSNLVLEQKIAALDKPLWKNLGENVFFSIVSAIVLAIIGLGFWLWQIKDNPEMLNKVNSGVTKQFQKSINSN